MSASAEGLRADARRNRTAILRAARRAVAAEGTSVSLALIARAAGVGAGTVHRHFPTKEGLLEAVLADRLDELVARAERRRDLTDPGGAFFALLTDVIESAGERGPLCDALRPDAGWPRTVLSAAVLRFEEALRDQLSAAQRSGAVRADVTAGEVRALIIGCVAMRASGSGGERMARAALRVLRAEGAPAGDVAAGGAPNRDAAPAPPEIRDGAGPDGWCRMCGAALEVRRVGRPARYCGPACRKRAQRRRDRDGARAV
ncbi:TetR/AcrR family transcriptional regulator [Nocardiopsis composta]|uniref:AcrR family transcriptional regulator n=1 Tax=Nocardiopsis composta TaxID=157465 RepID=A0A7W8VEY0_9ACTN|nr:TetR/AcrR family transcriptional regulator [Nocardiopsis composta]MBB5433812.1 AcrR family transcriptional regulator [Nocardiopsis composta]